MRKFLRQIPRISLALGLLSAMPVNAIAESRYFPDAAIAGRQGEKFTVQRIKYLDEDSLERQNLESWVDANRPEIEDL